MMTSLAVAELDWLDWDAPPECPGRDHIQTRLESWLSGPFEPQTKLRVQASVHWNDGVWRVHTDIEYGDTRGERTVLVDTCSEAADFVALNVAKSKRRHLRKHRPARGFLGSSLVG